VGRVPGTEGARGLLISSHHLFLGFHTEGVRVFDLHNPLSPAFTLQLLPGEEVSGLSAEGQRLCVSLSRGALSVFDIVDPASPKEMWVSELDEGVHDLLCQDGLLYAFPFHGSAVLEAVGGPGRR